MPRLRSAPQAMSEGPFFKGLLFINVAVPLCLRSNLVPYRTSTFSVCSEQRVTIFSSKARYLVDFFFFLALAFSIPKCYRLLSDVGF